MVEELLGEDGYVAPRQLFLVVRRFIRDNLQVFSAVDVLALVVQRVEVLITGLAVQLLIVLVNL